MRGMILAACAAMLAGACASASAETYDNATLSGTYHSVHAKSYWSNDQFPANFSLTITLGFSASGMDYQSVNDSNKAQPHGNSFHVALDDSITPLPGKARYNQVRMRQLGPRQFQVLENKDGDVIVGQIWQFSEDGRTLTRWGVGKAPDGVSKAFLETFERVAK
ncbi:hypothetical protein [Sphingobium yanoikuyae]|uniref:hypothetical protein n=1 Tax=Sphingobium yanoikuyae TaxID=13690 RepID=UPI0028AB5247|nr:hypothetical protein [Sphingobium yanoikuyae]